MNRALILGLALVVPSSTAAGAQQTDSAESSAGDSRLVWGLHVGGLQTASVSAGVLFDPTDDEAEERGPVAALEVGLDGAQVRGGYGRVSNLGSGYLISASLLRTWRHPDDAEPDQWYYGVQAQLHLFLINVRGQVFYGPDAAEGDDWRFTVSAGLGL